MPCNVTSLTGRRTFSAALITIAVLLAAAAVWIPARASAAPTSGGPQTTLVVASTPDPSQPGVTGNDVQTFNSAGAELGETAVGSVPYALAISPDAATAYVANQGSGTLTPVTVSSTSAESPVCVDVGGCAQQSQPEAVALSPDGTTAYVANSGEDSISEVDIAGGSTKLLGQPIVSSNFSEPDAVAVTPDGKTLWVANYGNGTVVSVNLATGKVGTPISLGAASAPTGLAITPDGDDLLVADSGIGTVSDVDLASSSDTVSSITIDQTQSEPAQPQAIAIAPDGSTAYVTDANNGMVVPIDLANDVPGTAVSVCPSGSSSCVADEADPTAIAISPDGTTAYVADSSVDQVAVLTLAGSGVTVTNTIATDGSPDALALTPDQAPKAAFTVGIASAGSATTFNASASMTVPAGGTLTYTWNFGDGSAIQTSTNPVVTHVYATAGSYTATLTVTDAAGTSTAQVFTGQTMSRNGAPSATTSDTFSIAAVRDTAIEAIVAGSAGTVTPVGLYPGSPPSATAAAPIAVGSSPAAVAIGSGDQLAFVANSGSGTVSQVSLNVAAAAPTVTIQVGSDPDAIAIAPSNRYLYVVDSGSSSLSVVTLRTRAVQTIPITTAGAGGLSAIAISPNGKYAYVLDSASNTIIPITLATGTVGKPVGGSDLIDPDAIAIAPNGKYAYVVDGGTATTPGGITVVNIADGTPVPEAIDHIGAAGGHPDAITMAPNGTAAYVTDAPLSGSTQSVAITPVTLTGGTATVDTPFAVSGATALNGIAITPAGTSAYATETTTDGSAVLPLAVNGATVSAGTPLALKGTAGAIAITPDLAPNATLSAQSPVAAGSPVQFSSAGSSSPTSPIASYQFNFGDGSAAVTVAAPTVTASHSYQVAGVYSARVVATDTAGTSDYGVYTGQMFSRAGSSYAVATQQVTVYPTLTRVGTPVGRVGMVGHAGEFVKIVGTGFSTHKGGTEVLFGTARSPKVMCRSNVFCLAVAPWGMGKVSVTVVVSGQSSPASSAGFFTYAKGPAIRTIRPAHGHKGTSVTIIGKGFSTRRGQTHVMFGKVAATRVTCSSPDRCVAVVPAGHGTVAVSVRVGRRKSPKTPVVRFTYNRPKR